MSSSASITSKTLGSRFFGSCPFIPLDWRRRKAASAAQAIIFKWRTEHERYPKGALGMRFCDNHAETRAIARFGERNALAASALVFTMTMDGVPMLYNGMEVGDTTESGAPALFEQLPVFWQISKRRSNFLPFYRQLIATRRAHPNCSRAKPSGSETARPITS